MKTIINKGQRRIIFKDGQDVKGLAPLREMKVEKAAAMLLVASFPNEVFLIEEVADEPLKIEKKPEGKKK